MARKVASMQVRLLAAVKAAAEAVDAGEPVPFSVSVLCREQGTSRKTFYKWVERCRADGLAGLEPRSTRPRSSPTRVGDDVEDAVVRCCKELTDLGVDAGAASIRWHLEAAGTARVPSEATIWRIKRRRGLSLAQPQKRPRSAWVRFAAASPNERWQIDATHWSLTDSDVEIINIIDDHSRLAVATMAVASCTTEAAWAAFVAGVDRCGLPASLLSDNGLAFSGRLRGCEVAFEVNLRAAGIRPITSRPYHPQTCGKVERFQQTEKKWLRARPGITTLRQLQQELDRFRDYYNHQRPHRGIGRSTPHAVWSATPHATTNGQPLTTPPRSVRATVDHRGTVLVRPWGIGLGVEYAGKPAKVVVDGTHAAVIIDGRLVRAFALDPTRRYQPTGRPKGGPKRRPD
jgi:transposase InsO family protein